MMNRNQHGFTLVELMIATVIFSMVLLMCSAALIQVSRYYQKGVTISNTQEAARNILSEIAGAIQFSGATPTFGGPVPRGARGYATSSICIGSTRFTYMLNAQVADASVGANHQAFHALWRDTLSGGATCSPPMNLDTSALSSGRELVPRGLRIVDLSFPPNASGVSDRLQRIHIRLMSGEDDILVNPNAPSGPTGCVSSFAGGAFCADVQLETTVYRRL